jgi:F-type H+-transporting ATPase subunit b
VLNFSVTFFITIVNLGVLYFALKKLLFGKVTKVMEDRAEKVRRDIDEAAANRQGAEELKTRYEALLANAENEAEWVVREAEERGRAEYQRIVAEAEAEASAIKRRAEERAAFELRRAQDELAGEVARLACVVAAKIAGKRIGGSEDEAEAEAFVRGIGASGGR